MARRSGEAKGVEAGMADVAHAAHREGRHAALSPREIQCLRLTAFGESDEAIAAALALSKSTVRFHLKNVCRKLDVNHRRSAIYKAAKTGII
jgi:DNA-binding CsgD family transcriptional regulator